jgi:methyl-accepting chemotaxis protein
MSDGGKSQPAAGTSVYKVQRKLVNFLLQPLLQLRIGLINVVLSFVFVLALGVYVYQKLIQFADVVETLTQADADVATLLRTYLASVGWTAFGLAIAFVLFSLCASVYMTHKLVGPTVAFRRHIRGLMDGNFTVKTRLRSGDAFLEVADDLNRLSDRLMEMLKR